MKKRFLSAALALAMVLTLLPVSVFAADGTYPTSISTAKGDGSESVTYIAKNGTHGETPVDDAPGWYVQLKGTGDYKNKTYYFKITEGFVISSRYYTEDNLPEKMPTTFTSIGGVEADMGTATSVTADVYDGTLTLKGEKLTSITVKNTKQDNDNTKCKVTLPSGWPVVDNKPFTLSLTNVGSTGTIDTVTTAMKAAVTGKVTLDNATFGEIKLGGTVDTKTATQTVELKNDSTSGAITVEGGTSSNKITIANSTVGTAGTGAAVTMTSAGGKIEVSGQSEVGDITVSSGSDAAKAVAVPSVSVTGGTVGEIKREVATSDKSTSANSITVSGGRTSTGAISTHNGSVSVTSATTDTIAVDNGSVTINGPKAETDQITLGKDSTGKVSIKVTGTGNVIGGIENDAGTLTVDLPAEPTNNYGEITDKVATKKYNGHNVKGGTFTGSVPEGWLANKGADALVFELCVTDADGNKTITYYNGSQLGMALTAQNLEAGNTLTYVGSGALPAQTITFKNGDLKWGELLSAGRTPIVLPTEVAGTTVSSWYDATSERTYPAGGDYTSAAGTVTGVTLNAQESSANASKLVNATAASTDIDKSVYVSLSGTVINVSGGVDTGNKDGAGIPVKIELYTDVDDEPEEVEVVYNPTSGAVTFAEGQTLGKGMTLEVSGTKGLDTLRLSNGTKYTLNGSGIKVLAGELGIDASTEVVITAKVSGLSNEQNKALAKELMGYDEDGKATAEFDWTDSGLMAQAVNAAAAGISESSLNGWVTKAQEAAWKAKSTDKVPSDVATKVGGFDKVWLIPYLAVNVTGFNDTGTMTATLTPSYRVVVKAPTTGDYTEVFKGTSNGDADGNYIVQTGRALGSLAGELGKIELTLGLSAPLDTAYMHQDSTYVYQGTGGVFEITHGSTNGLGTVVLNTTAPLVKLENPTVEENGDPGTPEESFYDTLQAAVDDAKDGGKITVGLGYKGSTTISVTGVARTFTIETKGSHKITSNASGTTVTPDKDGKIFTVQLTRDTAAPGQNIVVASATGGTAKVSANPAKVGETVTVTLTAASGYVASNVTVKTASGTTVSVSGSGSTYTFTMPAGTVTVTPSFKASDTRATIQEGSAVGGSIVTSAVGSGNKVTPGSTVTVTALPNNGYRSMGVTARANSGTAKVTRTGTNTWDVTVPSGATTVTVTPNFDIDNGTLFEDVRSNHWASKYVAWAYKNDYIDGTSTYAYSPSNYMTMGEVVAMLYKAAGSPSVAGMRNPFTNLTQGSHWAYDAFIWAANQGLISGGTINPWGYATRAEIVQILYRRAGSPTVYGTSGFADVANNASYAKAVTWARQKGLTNGYGGKTNFAPGYAVSRAEMAAFLGRAFGNMA